MPNIELVDMCSTSSIADTDLLYAVVCPGGTKADRSITRVNAFKGTSAFTTLGAQTAPLNMSTQEINNVGNINFQDVGCSFCGGAFISTSPGFFCPCFGTDLILNVCCCSAVHIKAGSDEMTYNGGFVPEFKINGASLQGVKQLFMSCGGGMSSSGGVVSLGAGNCGSLLFLQPASFVDRVLIGCVGQGSTGGKLNLAQTTFSGCLPSPVGTITFRGGFNPEVIYSTITTTAHSYDTTTEDATVNIDVMQGGTLTNYLSLKGPCSTVELSVNTKLIRTVAPTLTISSNKAAVACETIGTISFRGRFDGCEYANISANTQSCCGFGGGRLVLSVREAGGCSPIPAMTFDGSTQFITIGGCFGLDFAGTDINNVRSICFASTCSRINVCACCNDDINISPEGSSKVNFFPGSGGPSFLSGGDLDMTSGSIVNVIAESFTDCTRPAPCTVPPGRFIFNTTDDGLNVSNGTNWRGPSACGGWANT